MSPTSPLSHKTWEVEEGFEGWSLKESKKKKKKERKRGRKHKVSEGEFLRGKGAKNVEEGGGGGGGGSQQEKG